MAEVACGDPRVQPTAHTMNPIAETPAKAAAISAAMESFGAVSRTARNVKQKPPSKALTNAVRSKRAAVDSGERLM